MAKEKGKYIYVEPASYFSPGMLAAAEEWEKKHAEEERKRKEADKKNKKERKP